jgi:predicted HTH domain antitoxin
MSDTQTITIEIPREIERQLAKEWGDGVLSRRALEALVVEGYRTEALSAGQVAEILGLSGWETDTFLKEHCAYLHYSEDDLEADQQTLQRFFSK